MQEKREPISPSAFLTTRADALEKDGQRKLKEAESLRYEAESVERSAHALLSAAADNRRDAEFLEKFRGVPAEKKVEKDTSADTADNAVRHSAVCEMPEAVAHLAARISDLEDKNVVKIKIDVL
jgi:hypothetical protein